MSFFSKLFGRADPIRPKQSSSPGYAALSADDQAIARYRYMLQTAPPQTLEQAHAEAFAQLTPEQRSLLQQQLSAELPASERSVNSGVSLDDPQFLARMATRAEIRQPGTLERSFMGMGAGRGGMGSTLAGSLLGSMAGVVIGSAIAQSFFSDLGLGDPAGAHAVDADTDVAAASDAGDGDFDMGGFDGS